MAMFGYSWPCCAPCGDEEGATVIPQQGLVVEVENSRLGDQSVFRPFQEVEPALLVTQSAVYEDESVSQSALPPPEPAASSAPPAQEQRAAQEPIKEADESNGTQELPELQIHALLKFASEGGGAQAKTLLNNFTKEALVGRPCTLFAIDTTEQQDTQLRLDTSLTTLIFGPKTAPLITCPVAGIQDVYTYVEDGAEAFSTSLLAKLSDAQKNRLLMIMFEDTAGTRASFYMVESSEASRDELLEALRILNMYAADH